MFAKIFKSFFVFVTDIFPNAIYPPNKDSLTINGHLNLFITSVQEIHKLSFLELKKSLRIKIYIKQRSLGNVRI